MSSSPPKTDPGGEAGRIRCLYCGANNFPASANCWQCGRSLKAMPAGSSAEAPFPLPAPAMLPGQSVRVSPAFTQTESALAPKAAAALGLIFPVIGLPVGMVFLMLDDPRKTQIGWMTIGWSVLGTVLNTIAFSVLSAMIAPFLKGFMHPGGGSPGGLPSMPDMGGDGAGILLLRILAVHFLSLHV